MEREEALKHASHAATVSMVFDLNELESGDASDTAACDSEIRMPEVLVQQESYTTRDSIVFTPSPSDIRLSAYVGAGSVVEQSESNPLQVTPPTAMLSYQQQYVPNPIPPAIPVIPTLPYRAATPEVPAVEPAPRRKRAEAGGGGGGTVSASGKDPAQLAKRNERERAARAQESDAAKRERREKRRLADAHRETSEDALAHRKKTRRENDTRRRERKTEAERVEYNERRRELHRIRKEKKENGTFSAPRIASASASSSSSSSSSSTFSFSSSSSSTPPGAFIPIVVPFELGSPL